MSRCLEEGAEDFLLKPVKLADVKRLRNHLTKDIKLSNGNKRKVPEDSDSVDTTSTIPAPTMTLPPSPPLTTSSDSFPPLSPVDIFSVGEEDDDVLLTSSPESSPTTEEESPVRRQKMRCPGLD